MSFHNKMVHACKYVLQAVVSYILNLRLLSEVYCNSRYSHAAYRHSWSDSASDYIPLAASQIQFQPADTAAAAYNREANKLLNHHWMYVCTQLHARLCTLLCINYESGFTGQPFYKSAISLCMCQFIITGLERWLYCRGIIVATSYHTSWQSIWHGPYVSCIQMSTL